MSGGRLNYSYLKVRGMAEDVRSWSDRQLHKDFANHLEEVAKALHDLEWMFSCDTSPGSEDEAINNVLRRRPEDE